MRRTLLVVLSALALTAGTATYFAQGKAPAEPDLNATVASSPAELRNGVATYEQVAGYLGVDDSELHGEPVWEVVKDDLNLDGVEDLLISNALNNGPEGSVYAVFIGSSKGYRYVGNFQGEIRTLPVEKDKPVRFVIASFADDNKMLVELAELQAAGLHRLAKVEMTTGGCEAKDNPSFTELFCGKTVSTDTVKKVFGAK